MKNLSKLLLLTLASAALFLAGCTKKPTRPVVTDTQMGDNTIDPNAEAIATDLGGLESRTPGTPDDANKSVVEPIYFPLDRAAVPPGERGKLQAAVKWLADNPTKNLVLVGHCDWRGTAEYNLGLGDRRANSVKLFLQSLGVNPARLETLSKGSTLANKTGGEAEWAKDRRVDFIELIKQ